MFCEKCGTKLDEGSKFCHSCGASVGNNLSIPKKARSVKRHEEAKKISIAPDNPRGTAEEYLAKTDIKDKEEAKKYLSQLKALFWLVVLSIIIIRGVGESESESAAVLYIPFIGLMIYFVYFCVKVLKAEKLPKANALWCVFFAPFSYFYLYPLMADPLKIILGEKQPPVRLSDTERKQRASEANKKFWRTFWMIIGITGGLFALTLIAIYFLS